MTALRDRRGHDLGRALVLRDVTDRQRALRERARETEGALRDAQQRFRAIIDHTFELIGLLDPQGHLLTANRTALDFAGLDDRGAQALSSRPIWETPWWVQSDASPERLRAAVAAAAQGRFVRFEATQVHHSGERRSIDFSLKPVHDTRGNGHDGTSAGPVVLLIAEGRDVTELRRAETRERGARGAPASRAPAGGDRPARGRRRTRLQQPDHRDPRQRRGDPPGAAGSSTIPTARSR